MKKLLFTLFLITFLSTSSFALAQIFQPFQGGTGKDTSSYGTSSSEVCISVTDGVWGTTTCGSGAGAAPDGDWYVFGKRLEATSAINYLAATQTQDIGTTTEYWRAIYVSYIYSDASTSLRDLATRRLYTAPSNVQTISATSDTILSSYGFLRVSSTADFVMGSTPTINPGTDGQWLSIYNSGTATIDFQDNANFAGSAIFHGGTNGTLSPAEVLTLLYLDSLGGWVIQSHPNLQSVGGGANVGDARNVSGSSIAAGKAVYLTGFNIGQDRATIDLADADDPAKMPAVGVTAEVIANGANGTVVTFGTLRDVVDTSGFSVGDKLYVDTTAGELVNTRPSVDEIQLIGIVTRSHASNGRIGVTGAGRTNDIPIDVNVLGDLDVNGSTTIATEFGNCNKLTTASGILSCGTDADSWAASSSEYYTITEMLANYISTTTLTNNYYSSGTIETNFIATSSASTTDWQDAAASTSLLSTKTIGFDFTDATTTAGSKRDIYIFRHQSENVVEVGCKTESGTSSLHFAIAPENSDATSSVIISTLVCDEDAASSTSFVDSSLAARERYFIGVTGVTNSTTTYGYITFSIND